MDILVDKNNQNYIKDTSPYEKFEKIDNDFIELWEEFERNETEEARFIKNVDQLEFLLQACAYGFDAKYFERSLNKITNSYCKEIALAAIETTKGNKKPKVVG